GIAIGAKNKAMGENAVALGNQSSAMYTDTVGIGFGAHGDADAVIAIGRAAKGDALGGVAIGRYAEVHASTGVALGESSVSSRGAGVVGYMPGAVGQTAEEVAAYLGKAEEYKSWKEDREANQEAYEKVRAWSAAVEAERQAHNEINKARIAYAENSTEENKKAITEKQEAYKKASDKRQETDVAARPYYKTIEDLNSRYGQIFGKLMSTGGAVSVGNEKEGITRQIVNVAAGTKDTDAVNVYQLRDAVENFKQETRVAEDGKYVKKDKTAGENLTALDNQVKANTGEIGGLKDGMTDLDKRVKANAGEIGGLKDGMTDLTGRMDKLGTDSAVAEDGAYVKKDKKVGENLTALDKGIDKLVTDSAVAEDGAYVKKDKKVGENLTALDNQVKANAGEIGGLKEGITDLDKRVKANA
ncbi:Hep/Hag repeat protein, partial [Anaerococcus hydrogenalis]